jgi:hypothetical protein
VSKGKQLAFNVGRAVWALYFLACEKIPCLVLGGFILGMSADPQSSVSTCCTFEEPFFPLALLLALVLAMPFADRMFMPLALTVA